MKVYREFVSNPYENSCFVGGDSDADSRVCVCV